ncbi:MAG: chromosomal replication initiator protein DnaA [Chlamydiia bacterium]
MTEEVIDRSLADCWQQFLGYAQERCSATAYENWLAPIQMTGSENDELVLEVPNIFVKEYLLDNYGKDLLLFFARRPSGEPCIQFRITEPVKKPTQLGSPLIVPSSMVQEEPQPELKLNPSYVFANFIEGPANQFVKSAAFGVATHPGKTYNPLFIHGGVGLGKTHLLHAIGHYSREHNRKLRVQCITTEAFINELVDSLRNKSVDRLKRYYRTLDILLVDDIQFLQSRLNFEEEFCNTFESLINQNKQIVITSDKPPSQLKLSERMVARMEWGLVAHVGVPDLETRVAILQAKAEAKGLHLPNKIAFFIAEHIYNNVRQLEGAVNRLTAHCRLLKLEITEEFVEKTLREMLQQLPPQRVTIDGILKSVASVFQVKVSDLKGSVRTKEVALPRQVAMFLAKEMVNESLVMVAASFGKTHSTILHACKAIERRTAEDELLRRQIDMVRRNLEMT